MLMQPSPLYRKRKRTNLIGLTLSMIAMSLGLIALLWILFVLFGRCVLKPARPFPPIKNQDANSSHEKKKNMATAASSRRRRPPIR